VFEDDDLSGSGDWTRPGVYRCAPDVFRIPLPLPMDGLRAVNVYAVRHGAEVTLIDAGWAIPQARELLAAGLAELDAGFPDVHRFLVTHIHRDHYTQAVAVRRAFGTRVALGAGERRGLETINDPDQPEGPIMAARLRRAGGEAVLAKLNRLRSPHLDMADWAAPDEWIADGELLAVGDRTLVAVETPGHTRGHLVFADEAADIMFCGDHVLPRITPSIGLEPDPQVSPLADFLSSLELIRKRPDARMLPAHGPVGMRVHERVDELIAHHAKRLDATFAALAEGRSTAYDVAGVLKWTRRERALAELDPFNEMLATLETMAHLEVLVERGLATRTEEDGVAHYAP
jgi:glyoxylase-like metal-dependent hydrolase (beta-lactamase superfamily II)